ncbi:MAG TPA: T9SS type A sorting domain-containing protein [Flavisolibacter sp.]|nr:T9SS type A sorting domain-containing protein [Flavisolibacter sp.]
MKNQSFALLLIFSCAFFQSNAQRSGLINRTATSVAGRAVLDPNGDGYTSTTSAGFGASDVANSEIVFSAVPCYTIEPYGDLRRGPNHLYSDFVPDNQNHGVYIYYSGTNLLFRFRMGSIMTGSKGYSVLFDTDGRFGAAGANADPNYQAATTGVNGNPGFELEIVLETNSRIAIYNVDGTGAPTLVKAYSNWQDMSQVSVAGTFDNGDPDFLIDFYVPFSDLQAAPFNLTANSNLRFAATTVMSPQAAIGGPKSDIYGLSDDAYKSTNAQYEAYINAQPPMRLSVGSFGPVCTEAPVVNSPVGTGTVSISGTWTRSALSGAVSTAAITVYKNGVAVGTVSGVASSSTWTLNNIAVANADVITAKAQASGESMCLVSNAVTASSCSPANRPALPSLTCANNYSKGVSGNNLASGWVTYVENLTRGTIESSVANAAQFTTSGTSPNITWNYAGGCNGGPNMPSGTYKIYYMNPSGCTSEAVYFCLATGSGTSNNLAGTAAIPVISSILSPGATVLTGTGEPNSTVSLLVNGMGVQSVTASAAGVFSFSNLSLINGDQVQVTNVLTTGTVSTSKCIASSIIYTVSCYSQPPVITADNNGEISSGLSISGYAPAPSSVIRVYTAANVLVATTTAQANGLWSTGNAGTSPSAYSAVASTSYYATAQTGSCAVSSSSASVAAVGLTASSRCGSITGPVSSGATSVSGTLNGSFTSSLASLYLDGISIGSVSTNTAAWGPIAVNTTSNNGLYANGVLTIGIKETGKQEVLCPASATTISCASLPASPIVSPANFSTTPNQSVTYTISNAVAGTFYGIADASTGRSLATGVWATSNGSLSISTNTFTSSGTYSVVIKATSLSGLTVCSSAPSAATVAVNGVLPVSFLDVSARKEALGNAVRWLVAEEQDVAYYVVERSSDGISFAAAGQVAYSPLATSPKQYGFTDAQALAGRIYYRIRQVDLDGKSHFSKTVTVQSGNDATVNVFPNPAAHSASVYLLADREDRLTLQVIDAGGRTIDEQQVQLGQGANTIPVKVVPRLASGHYHLKIITGSAVYYRKLVVQ